MHVGRLAHLVALTVMERHGEIVVVESLGKVIENPKFFQNEFFAKKLTRMLIAKSE